MKDHKESKQAQRINAMLSSSNTPEYIVISDDDDEPPANRTTHVRSSGPSVPTHVREDMSQVRLEGPATRRTISAPSNTTIANTQPSGRPLPPPNELPLNRNRPHPASSAHSTGRKHSRSKSRERRTLRPTSRQAEEARERRRSRRPNRAELEKGWTESAMKEGARGIRIVNEIDDELIPNIPDDFEWLERDYQYPADYQKDEMGHSEPCKCTGLCGQLSQCDCFDRSDLGDFGKNRPSYTKDGYLIEGLESVDRFLVHECTDLCPCAPTCRNRVAQWPRDVALEIFKTARCGWGVRATVDLPKGKVLGIYTGELSERDDDEEKNYVGHSSCDTSPSDGDTPFDSEGSEGRDMGNDNERAGGKSPKRRRLSATAQQQLEESYVFLLDFNDAKTWQVGAYKRGNWTRFVNHCCQPNLRVYTLTYDTDPLDEALPTYIAFVTKKAIPAGQELTFDYDPRFANSDATEKPQKKPSLAEDVCYCGARRCRGFMRLPV